MEHSKPGMNAKRLSERLVQPGHDRSFRKSEQNFVAALQLILTGDDYRVVDHPRDLAAMFGGRYGIVPEASIECVRTRRKFYFEVKKQGPQGNAEERACKHHTVAFYKALRNATGYDYHAFGTIMCDSLATDARYTLKFPYFFEPEHYLLWVNYDVDVLANYVRRVCSRFLLGPNVP